jgi:hypothetical protein
MLGKSRLYHVGVNVIPVHALKAHGGGGGNYSFTDRRQMEVGGQHYSPAALPQEITMVTIEKGGWAGPRVRHDDLEMRITRCPCRQSILRLSDLS